MASIDTLLKGMAQVGASDLHLATDEPPRVRVDGAMRTLSQKTLPLATMRELLREIASDDHWAEYEETRDTDFAYALDGVGRFRANYFRTIGGPAAVFRLIPDRILSASELGLSEAILRLCTLRKGLVLVTGPTGSGKSTTLAAMIDHVNQTRAEHIITVEDPVEFVHPNKRCLVSQREVGTHTRSFGSALRAALREDPDVILVGELRDLETTSIALEMAETGHLVFATLHTTTAAKTVDRVIDQFPAEQQEQVRAMLSTSLKGVISQTLLKKKAGGRVAALEVLLVTGAVANSIREGKTHQIALAMQTGKQLGMRELNDALMERVLQGVVEPREALSKAVDRDALHKELLRHGQQQEAPPAPAPTATSKPSPGIDMDDARRRALDLARSGNLSASRPKKSGWFS